ncbi:AVIToxin-VAR2 [Collichthys lucidus]|uniref:AVIToxin-VAR2 n=1 Tax=Collichthys lucidus TaxID=240159 RepID=A0A4U5UD33_COLLU|nr:AVIToxin-VAR2 [Collichthys lucidus]
MHMQRGPTASASLLFTLEGTDRQPFIMRSFFLLLVSLLLVSHGSSAVITGVPFFGKRVHHTCPCLPNLSCITIEEGRSKCLSTYKYPDLYL